MRNETVVSKWGNSLAVRIPKVVAKEARLSEGDFLAMELTKDGRIVLQSTRRKYELRDLVSQIAPGNRHTETDWGKAQGKESWQVSPA